MVQTKIEFVGLGNITDCSSSGNTLFEGGTGPHSTYFRFGMTHINSKIGSSYIQLNISGTAPTIKLHVYVAAVFRITYTTGNGVTTSPFRILIHAEVPAGSLGTINAPIYNPGDNKSPIWGAYCRSWSSGVSSSTTYNYTSITIQEITTTPNIYIISDSADSNLVYDNLYNEQPWTFIDTVDNILAGTYSNSNGVFSNNGNVYYSSIFANYSPIVPILTSTNTTYFSKTSMVGKLNDTDGADVKGIFLHNVPGKSEGNYQIYPPVPTITFSNIQLTSDSNITFYCLPIKISFIDWGTVFSNCEWQDGFTLGNNTTFFTSENSYVTLNISSVRLSSVPVDTYVWITGTVKNSDGTGFYNLWCNECGSSFMHNAEGRDICVGCKIPAGTPMGNYNATVIGRVIHFGEAIYRGGVSGNYHWGWSVGNMGNNLTNVHIAIISDDINDGFRSNNTTPGGNDTTVVQYGRKYISGIHRYYSSADSEYKNIQQLKAVKLYNTKFCNNCAQKYDFSDQICTVCGAPLSVFARAGIHYTTSTTDIYGIVTKIVPLNNYLNFNLTTNTSPRYLTYSTHYGGVITSIDDAIKLKTSTYVKSGSNYLPATYNSTTYSSMNINNFTFNHTPAIVNEPIQDTCFYDDSVITFNSYNTTINNPPIIPNNGFTMNSYTAVLGQSIFGYAFTGYFTANNVINTPLSNSVNNPPFDFNPSTYVTRYLFNFGTYTGWKTEMSEVLTYNWPSSLSFNIVVPGPMYSSHDPDITNHFVFSLETNSSSPNNIYVHGAVNQEGLNGWSEHGPKYVDAYFNTNNELSNCVPYTNGPAGALFSGYYRDTYTWKTYPCIIYTTDYIKADTTSDWDYERSNYNSTIFNPAWHLSNAVGVSGDEDSHQFNITLTQDEIKNGYKYYVPNDNIMQINIGTFFYTIRDRYRTFWTTLNINGSSSNSPNYGTRDIPLTHKRTTNIGNNTPSFNVPLIIYLHFRNQADAAWLIVKNNITVNSSFDHYEYKIVYK